MRRSPWIAAMLACIAGAAHAEDADFTSKSRSVVASIPAAHPPAPFAASHEAAVRDASPARESIPFQVEHAAGALHSAPSACEGSSHAVCYDAAEGRIVYRGARGYMPRIGELTPESLSLRRNRIVFKYSF